jgi:hypothetical protein
MDGAKVKRRISKKTYLALRQDCENQIAIGQAYMQYMDGEITWEDYIKINPQAEVEVAKIRGPQYEEWKARVMAGEDAEEVKISIWGSDSTDGNHQQSNQEEIAEMLGKELESAPPLTNPCENSNPVHQCGCGGAPIYFSEGKQCYLDKIMANATNLITREPGEEVLKAIKSEGPTTQLLSNLLEMWARQLYIQNRSTGVNYKDLREITEKITLYAAALLYELKQ